jgi:hypothetical protein
VASIDRRTFIAGLAASGVMVALPCNASAAEREWFAAARRDPSGTYSAALFDLKNGDLRAVELPGRGHDVALRPGGKEWVAFARRPGRFGVVVPIRKGTPVWFASKADRHFYGHGTFSADGKLLYTAESDYDNAHGMIGVRDATGGYRQIGEIPAHGIEPHDIALLRDGRTMVVANGGIETHPDTGRAELNLADMQPSLNYVDIETGDLLEQHKLAPELHQNSIRHLAIGPDNAVAFACQYRGPDEDVPPLVGFHRRGEDLVIVPAPEETQRGMRNYVGSIDIDSSGSIVAASSPRGGVITYWDVTSRNYLGACNLVDGCGLAPTHRSTTFLLTSGAGWLGTGEPDGTLERQPSDYHWDHHAILVR